MRRDPQHVSYFIYWSEEGERAAAETKAGRSERQKIVCEDFGVCESLFSVERSVKRVKSDFVRSVCGSCGCVVSFGMGEIWIFGMHCLGRKTLPYLDSLRRRAFPCSYATVSAHRTRYSFLFFSLATSSLSIFSLCRSIALLTTSLAGSTFFVGPNGLLGALILLNCVAKYVAIGVAAAANRSGHASAQRRHRQRIRRFLQPLQQSAYHRVVLPARRPAYHQLSHRLEEG